MLKKNSSISRSYAKFLSKTCWNTWYQDQKILFLPFSVYCFEVFLKSNSEYFRPSSVIYSQWNVRNGEPAFFHINAKTQCLTTVQSCQKSTIMPLCSLLIVSEQCPVTCCIKGGKKAERTKGTRILSTAMGRK